MNHHRALGYCLSMIFSENRFTLFRIMLSNVFERSMPSDLIRGWIPVRIAIKVAQIAYTYLRRKRVKQKSRSTPFAALVRLAWSCQPTAGIFSQAIQSALARRRIVNSILSPGNSRQLSTALI
jgi:hypothetical protein